MARLTLQGMSKLTIPRLCKEAQVFSRMESFHAEPLLFGITDGKAVGTYLEHKFRKYLQGAGYVFQAGNTGSGIDFPSLDVDMKVTSIRQPQSSCPYKNARQKIYGLGYALLVFVYDKVDDPIAKTGTLNILHALYLEKEYTADHQTTRGLRAILDNEGSAEDIIAFLSDRYLPVDEIELNNLANEILQKRPELGYLTISNALQWRLNYSRAIEKAGNVAGVKSVFKGARR